MFNLAAPISSCHSCSYPLTATNLPNPGSHPSDLNHLKDQDPMSEDEADNSPSDSDDSDHQLESQVSQSVAFTVTN